MGTSSKDAYIKSISLEQYTTGTQHAHSKTGSRMIIQIDKSLNRQFKNDWNSMFFSTWLTKQDMHAHYL